MALFKRGKQYWMDVNVRGQRYREPLDTTDWREAKALERDRVQQIETRGPVPTGNSKAYAALDVATAIQAYARERRAQVSPRMAAYWLENAKPLAAFFGTTKLRHITSAQIADYQNARTDAGRAPKTINGELSVLRQVMKHARTWYRCEPDYRVLRNRKPAVGQALTPDEQDALFAAARTTNAWLYAYVASTLAFYCGMRACEIKALHWGDIDFTRQLLHIRRSKTPAGWRSPTLNPTCLQVLQELHDRAEKFGFTQPTHFVFPWHGRNKQIDPTRSMTSWREAWRAMRKNAGLPHVRFHDGRHTAITTLAEKGLPDWVIQAQVGHVSPEMMKTYSHIRREALNEAAAALEPASRVPDKSTPPDSASSVDADRSSNPTDRSQLGDTKPRSEEKREIVTSQFTSQNDGSTDPTIEFLKDFGSSGWTRTSNPPVNSVFSAPLRWVAATCFGLFRVAILLALNQLRVAGWRFQVRLAARRCGHQTARKRHVSNCKPRRHSSKPRTRTFYPVPESHFSGVDGFAIVPLKDLVGQWAPSLRVLAPSALVCSLPKIRPAARTPLNSPVAI